jgi:4-amino-4-deoxy-L-arabinose transferase-like glycosyltransferase
MKTGYTLSLNLLILLIGSVLFVPFLESVHLFDWDEVNFAESAREMLLTQNFSRVQIDFEPFWEKPPLFIWLQTIAMHFFGINEFAARLPNAITGIITLMILFNIGRRNFDINFGLFWALCYAGSILPHFYFKSGIIDPVFNLFIFLGIYQLSLVSSRERRFAFSRIWKIFLAGLFIGLAVLTKGPAAILIALLCIIGYGAVKKSYKIFTVKELLIFFLAIGGIAFFWFGIETIKNGPWFIKEFIIYQIRLFRTEDAGHGGPFFYHFVVLYLGCFPASVYLFRAFEKQYSDTLSQRVLKLWMIISLFVVLILFSIVKTKIVHYSSFCYFPITFLAAYTLHKLSKNKLFLSKYIAIHVVLIGSIISLVLILLPLFLKYKEYWLPRALPYIRDDFFLASLQTDVYWSGLESIIGVLYLAAIIYVAFIGKDFMSNALILFFTTLIVVQVSLNFFVPNIEKYVQGDIIDFYKSVKDENAYIRPHGYKSYAHLFYGEKKQSENPAGRSEDWLLTGPIDKPVYFVTKITNRNLDNFSDIKKIGRRNGYVIYLREPK